MIIPFAGKDTVQPPEGLNSSMHADWISLVEREQTVIELLGVFGRYIMALGYQYLSGCLQFMNHI